jgi:hypothetical protein
MSLQSSRKIITASNKSPSCVTKAGDKAFNFLSTKQKTNSVAFSPKANYTD